MDEIISRHKREQRDLIGVLTSLKKQANKKTKREVQIKCQALQAELDHKQRKELEELNSDGGTTEGNTPEAAVIDELNPEDLLKLTIQSSPSADPIPDSSPQPEAPRTKRNRQKERLARRNAKIEQMKSDAVEESKDLVDYRQIEIDTMNQLLELNNLKVHEIVSDGNCLFNSIGDQLSIRHNKSYTVQQLREMASDYIEEHPEDFVPFLMEKDEVIDIKEYCTKLTTTTMWGSDIEVLAFSNIFDCAIEIFVVGSSKLVFNEQGLGPKLLIAFYKHNYGLGEHYNSVWDC